jgi:aminopeptidase 2
MLINRENIIKILDLSFYKLNADYLLFFRTSYTSARLTKLSAAAKQGLLTIEDRASMIADVGALSISSYQKTFEILSLLKSFNSEDSYVI